MGSIIVSISSTVDGAVADPTGEEGAPGGGWFGRVGPLDRAAFGEVALEEALGADTFLMGRRTYAFLAARWPARSGALADRLNALPKHVVCTTLPEPAWAGTTALHGDPVQEVAALKQRVARDIVVPASFRLVATLLAHDLVDELRVVVFPTLLGGGTGDGGGRRGGPAFGLDRPVALDLRDTRSLGEHLTRSVYSVVRPG